MSIAVCGGRADEQGQQGYADRQSNSGAQARKFGGLVDDVRAVRRRGERC